MRDDRCKGTALPKQVRKLCRMAEREADRAQLERLRLQALVAFSSEAEREISQEFRRRLRQHDEAPGLFDASELAASAQAGLEVDIARNLEAGVVVDSTEATRSALRQRSEGYVRELRRKLITDRRPDARMVSGIVKDAFDEAALPAAKLILDAHRAPRIENRVRLDEDLRAPRDRGAGL
jgi:hypothetical protein